MLKKCECVLPFLHQISKKYLYYYYGTLQQALYYCANYPEITNQQKCKF